MIVETAPLTWDELEHWLQIDLSAMDALIRAAVPSAQTRPGSNSSRAWVLHCYRVYTPAPGTDIDPVVVGISISRPDGAGAYTVRADIAGETLGDVLVELPPRRAASQLEAGRVARLLGEELLRHADAVIRALRDETRRA